MVDAMPTRTDASTADDPGPGVSGPVPGWWRWLIVGAYLVAIFVASSQSRLPELPGHPSDKVQHSTAYGMLGALIVWALVRGDSRRITLRTVVIATVCGVLYGWSDEFHQIFIPERNYELHDLLADGMGTFVVSTVLWAWGIIARGGMRTHDV